MQVNYINAHATSTLVGDIAELNAVKKVFPHAKNLKMNGTKSLIGHSLGAAGGMEGIATLKAIQTSWLHPTINQVCSPSSTSASAKQCFYHIRQQRLLCGKLCTNL